MIFMYVYDDILINFFFIFLVNDSKIKTEGKVTLKVSILGNKNVKYTKINMFQEVCNSKFFTKASRGK